MAIIYVRYFSSLKQGCDVSRTSPNVIGRPIFSAIPDHFSFLFLKSEKDWYVFRIPSMIILRLISKKFRDVLVEIMG